MQQPCHSCVVCAMGRNLWLLTPSIKVVSPTNQSTRELISWFFLSLFSRSFFALGSMVERAMSEEIVCHGYANGVFRVCFETNNSPWAERFVGRIFYMVLVALHFFSYFCPHNPKRTKGYRI